MQTLSKISECLSQWVNNSSFESRHNKMKPSAKTRFCGFFPDHNPVNICYGFYSEFRGIRRENSTLVVEIPDYFSFYGLEMYMRWKLSFPTFIYAWKFPQFFDWQSLLAFLANPSANPLFYCQSPRSWTKKFSTVIGISQIFYQKSSSSKFRRKSFSFYSMLQTWSNISARFAISLN